MEKRVKIKLFKDNGNYRDDVFVSVNGRDFLIKRGEEVSVPDYVAEVLENSIKQERNTATLIEKLENSYHETERKLKA